MKKGCFLFLLVIVWSICINNIAIADDFTLHNGIKFGMSVNEVKQIESNLTFTDALQNNTFKDMKDVKKYTVLESDFLTLAGAKNSKLFYFFKDDKLVSCFYSHAGLRLMGSTLSASENEDVLSKLTEKYGQPISLNTEKIRLNKWAWGEEPSYSDLGVYPDAIDLHVSRYFDSTYNLTFGQWIVPNENEYVDIMLYYTVYDGGSPDYRVISYTLRTNEEVGAVLEAIDTYEQSLNNDL